MSTRGGGRHHMADTGGIPHGTGGGSTSAGGRRQGVGLQLWCLRVVMLQAAAGASMGCGLTSKSCSGMWPGLAMPC